MEGTQLAETNTRCTLTRERMRELHLWADRERWPSWAMVMYVNNISVQEAMDFYNTLLTPSRKSSHVRKGIEEYTGGVVGWAKTGATQYVLTVPTEYREGLQRE